MDVAEFEWDDENEEYLSARIGPEEVDSILDAHRLAVIRNKNNRAGSHRVMGVSSAGRLITVVVSPTGRAGVWRPVNAWLSDREETAHARKAGLVE